MNYDVSAGVSSAVRAPMPSASGAASDALARLRDTPAFRRELARLDKARGAEGAAQISFPQADPAAWSMLAALVCAELARRDPKRRAWLLAPDVRVQDRLHAELQTWGIDAIYLPELEIAHFEDAIPDPDVQAERLSALQKVLDGESAVGHPFPPIVLLAHSLDEDIPTAASAATRWTTLATGDTADPASLARDLEDAGYERASLVTRRGEFAVRGGILDVFSWQAAAPVRIEFFDDAIESVRSFDLDSQTSIARLSRVELMLGADPGADDRFQKLSDLVGADDTLIAVGAVDCPAHVVVSHGGDEGDDTACAENPLGAFEAGDFVLQEARRESFRRQLSDWAADGWSVWMFFNNDGEVARFAELMEESAGADSQLLPRPAIGRLARGFVVPSAKLAILSDAEVFGRYQHVRAQRQFGRERARAARTAELSLRDIRDGDLVVHIDYGIAMFRGLSRDEAESAGAEDVLVLEFGDEAKLYVPLPQSHLVSRYVGAGRKAPPLSRLGDARWGRTRRAAERAILDYAAQLLKVQAERQTLRGIAHPADTRWQYEFEQSFLFKETPDQLRAIEATKSDMERERPMDRLICGDVGFGKTEVAIRAAFKAVMGGRQVAILVPTTVLAQQHFGTFRERMSDYPVTIELLSRFRTGAQQRRVVAGLADGSVDIVIGTHRLISKDVSFRNLGLAVIDEEQRFGVKHKEQFKDQFRLVDVLTLSATPIPRTLYLSLMGARDMSTIETPPPNRLPVQTTICPYDERVIRAAVERELSRSGQVFLLHNRVKSIARMKSRVEELVPGARVEFGHGQMHEHDLEDVMLRFVHGETDVLVCTTIIESGVDIPNANTIIIDRADRFGLADLYQLRGRVGRSGVRAYAILLLPRDMMAAGDARKRINAIRQYSSLGAGFRIAMRDLEIRGAGNLLGLQQSGHIAAVGFDLYCQLLKQTVARLSGSRTAGRIDVAVRTDFVCLSESSWRATDPGRLPAFIPSSYIADANLRIAAYRAVAEISSRKDLSALVREWRDRFGPLPDPADHLLRLAELKLAAAASGISAVEISGNRLMLTRNGEFILLAGKFPRLSAVDPVGKLKDAIAMIRTI